MTKLYGSDWQARYAQPDEETQPAETYVRDSLGDLAALGINLKMPVDTFVADIVSELELEADDLEDHDGLRHSLLCTLGMEDESDGDGDGDGDPVYLSDDVWWLELDCIDDVDAYPRIVRRLSQMARGAFDVSDVAFAPDADDVYRLRLTFQGAEHTFTPAMEDDQIDPELLGWVDDLLVRSGSPKRFYVLPGRYEERLVLFTDESTYTRLLDELLSWPRGDWRGKTPAQIMRDDSRRFPGTVPSSGRWKSVTLVVGIVLLVAVFAVLTLGGSLPGLKNLTRDATTDYLDTHLPVGYTYQGEHKYSTHGHRQYQFTDDTGEDFQCSAIYDDTAIMQWTRPELSCSWAVAYAERHDDVLRQTFSPWVYDSTFRHEFGYVTITFQDETDVAALAQAITQALETIRTPVTSDPDDVFNTFSFHVEWAPQGENPRSVGYFEQQIGSAPALTVDDIQRKLEARMANP